MDQVNLSMGMGFGADFLKRRYDSSRRPGTPPQQQQLRSLSDSSTSSSAPSSGLASPQPLQSLSNSGSLGGVLAPLTSLRLSSSCSALPAAALGGGQAQAQKRQLQLVESHSHNVRHTPFPTTVSYPYVAGCDAVRAMLRRNVCPVLLNGVYASGLFKQVMYARSPGPHTGIYTSVLGFCAELGRVLSVLCYDPLDWSTEPTREFWNSLYDCAKQCSPCILVVHNVTSTARHDNIYRPLYEWIHTTWKTRQQQRQQEMQRVWLLFIDRIAPWEIEPDWGQFSADQIAEYVYPPAAERQLVVRSLIELRLLSFGPLGVTRQFVDQKLAEYDVLIAKCTLPLTVNEELELGTLGVAAEFVKALFVTAACRAPALDSSVLTLDAIVDALPTADDFDIVIKSCMRRRIRLEALEFEAMVSTRAPSSADDGHRMQWRPQPVPATNTRK
jgi:hypothetical protein